MGPGVGPGECSLEGLNLDALLKEQPRTAFGRGDLGLYRPTPGDDKPCMCRPSIVRRQSRRKVWLPCLRSFDGSWWLYAPGPGDTDLGGSACFSARENMAPLQSPQCEFTLAGSYILL